MSKQVEENVSTIPLTMKVAEVLYRYVILAAQQVEEHWMTNCT
jgi:hypothetical protein